MAPLLCFKKTKRSKRGDGSTIQRTASKSSTEMGVSTEGITLYQVTKRIIALTTPSTSSEAAYKETLGKAIQKLKIEHFDCYKIWNVSQIRNDLKRCGPVVEMGWPAPLAPPLDRLCVMCKQWEQWLTDPDHVVVVHSKGEPSRAAMAVCAFMHFNAICANDDSIEDRFAMQRYADRFIGAQGQPSHKRYLTYFSNLLSGKTRVNPAAIYLQKIVVHHLNDREIFFKVYEKMKPIFSSQTHSARDSTKFEVENEVKLRGDILLKCFEIKDSSREVLFICQFNTCALELFGKTPSLEFFKEELDLIFADSDIDNKCKLELYFALEPPPALKLSRKRSTLSEASRVDSYEEFCEPEDVDDVEVQYGKIQKPIAPASEDSGVSTESPSKEETAMGPPPVPPRTVHLQRPDDETSQGEYVQSRGVLPAAVKPLVEAQKGNEAVTENGTGSVSEEVAHKEEKEAEKATPSLEPDLVGKDRYDKASKCFSYVPAKSLKEAYSQPRKPPSRRILERRENLVDQVQPEELSRASEFAKSTDLVRRPESPKWTDTIDQADASTLYSADARIPSSSDMGRVRERPKWDEEIDAAFDKTALRDTSQKSNGAPERSRSAVGERIRYGDPEEKNWSATLASNGSMRRKTNYGSYRMLDNERYESDMDNLCDPEYYLNFGTNQRPAAPNSEQLPRKNYSRMTEPLNDYPPAASSLDVSQPSRDAYRQRNCRSVTTTSRRPQAYEIQDSAPQDDWLSMKLNKLKSKRDMDPDLVRRRTQEKMLLEELKNVSENGDGPQRSNVARDSVPEAMAAARDPLEAYRREEERLRNTSSPFDDMPRRNYRGVRGKPPTPPPRERSHSPPQTRTHTQTLESYPRQNGYSQQRKMTFDDDFSHLGNIVKNDNASTDLQRPSQLPQSGPRDFGLSPASQHKRPSFGAEPSLDTWSRGRETPSNFQDNRYAEWGSLSRAQTPSGQFFSGQERVAAAIARAETPLRHFLDGQARPNSTLNRAETPNFPLPRDETPLPYHPLLYNQNSMNRPDHSRNESLNYRSASPRSTYYNTSLSRRSSMNSVDPGDIIHHHPVFVKDVSKFWYKPTISREQAINMLLDKAPGTFVVRDSNSFPGAFGLALKVATPPAGVQPGDGTELVRHFLIEPSPKGVKLKGCHNEPVFGSLAALVYQHSITPLALPAKLILPDFDPANSIENVSAAQLLLEQGAACNVSYIGSVDCESLTGPTCVKRSVDYLNEEHVSGHITPVSVHFKVSSQGVTLTDNTRTMFFRQHFPRATVIYAGADPENRRWDNSEVLGFSQGCVRLAKIFAIVVRKLNSLENECHVFAEFEQEQPAHAVVNFINKVLLAPSRNP